MGLTIPQRKRRKRSSIIYNIITRYFHYVSKYPSFTLQYFCSLPIIRVFLGAVRLQIREILTERKGDELSIGVEEAVNEGKYDRRL